MDVLEKVLLVVLLVSALFIIVAILLQKSNDEGLSGSIAGGSDTFYGKDKSSHTERTLYISTIIAAIVFVLAVFAVFAIQPDFSNTFTLDNWKTIPESLQSYGEHINKYADYFTAK